jgi:serine/threonine protein kinase
MTSRILWTNLHQYRVLETIGRGGFGTVSKAIRLQDNEVVAIKRLNNPSSRFNLEKLKKEANELFRLRHIENVISLLDFNLECNEPFLVLEYCPWGTVQDLKNRGQLSFSNLHSVASSAAKALAVVHWNNGIHRDVKPSNLLIGTGNSEQLVVKLADFGLTNLAVENTKITRTVRGTPDYWSPEVKKGTPCTPENDIYALGISLIELLTGFRQPGLIDIHLEVPVEFRNLLRQMVATNPKDRPTAEEIVLKLQKISRKPNFNFRPILECAVTVIGVFGLGYGLVKLLESDS